MRGDSSENGELDMNICINNFIIEYLYNQQIEKEMIKKILSSQKIYGRPHYQVQWNDPKKLPSWVTADDCPEIIKFVARTGYSIDQELKKRGSFANIQAAIAKEQKPQYSMFRLKKVKNIEKGGKQKKQSYAKKLQKQGIQRYKPSYLQRLEKVVEKLALQIQRPKSSIILDYQIKYIEAVFKTMTNQICFIVSIIGKSQKFAIPLKKMKKHFPRSLKEYLQELILVNRYNQPCIEPSVRQNNVNDDSDLYFQSSSAPKSKDIQRLSRKHSSYDLQEESAQKTPVLQAVQNTNQKGQDSPIRQNDFEMEQEQGQSLQSKRPYQPIFQSAPSNTAELQKQKYLADIFSEDDSDSDNDLQ